MADTEGRQNVSYGAYYQATAAYSEDAELTHVGPGAPCGEYFRRFWHPVALSTEVKDVPLAIRILGEDLVLFRDLGGRTGLLLPHCSHRGTSLEFGIVSERGIRCCYHGWLYDVDGTILETPGEPPTSRLKHGFRHGAYPTLEYAGLIFAYMGPPEEKPEFPIYDTMQIPGDRMVPYSIHSPCNWLQISENGSDPVHGVFLHSRVTGNQFPGLAAFIDMPVLDWHERAAGFFYTNARRVGDNIWVRMHDQLLPNFGQNGTLHEEAKNPRYFGRPGLTRWVVPIDNTNSKYIAWRHLNERSDPYRKGRPDQIGIESVDFYGQTAHRSYEERQRNPGDYDAWVSQGPINIHKREHLGSTDKGVALLRRRLRRAIEELKNGKRPPQPTDIGRTPIPTYGGDTIVRVPKSNVDDQNLILEASRKIAKIYFEGDQYEGDDRVGYIERRIRETFET